MVEWWVCSLSHPSDIPIFQYSISFMDVSRSVSPPDLSCKFRGAGTIPATGVWLLGIYSLRSYHWSIAVPPMTND